MNILVVPDVHGRTFWRYALEHIDDYDKIVFLGDYLDPYYYEGINWETAVEQFKDILKFREDNPDKVILLCGNHDLSYIVNRDLFHSRHNVRESSKVHKLCEEVPFKIAYEIDGCLFTHAGVTREWLKGYELTIENLLKFKPAEITMELSVVGRQRGGWEKTGSCMWCDINEFIEGDHNLGYFQIFGHTQLLGGIIRPKEFAAIDCHKCFELNTETKELKVIDNE